MSSPIDHVAAMKALLPAQFYTQPNLLVWVSALGNRLNELDSSANDLMTLTHLNNATGTQLDGWGEILGQARGGLADGPYLAVLQAVAVGHASKCTPPNLIALFFRLVGGLMVQYSEPAAAEAWLAVTSPSPITDYPTIKSIMDMARAAGINLNLEYAAAPVFAFAEDTDPNTAGFADLSIPGSGGNFSTLI